MKTFGEFFQEDAGDKIRAMSDSQIADMKAKNPGAASKIDALRSRSSKGGALVKKQPSQLPPADKGGALVKRKPDLRKSQLGKWSQGVKSNPNSVKKDSGITKSSPNKPTFPDSVEKVKVKDLGRDGSVNQQGYRPGTTKPQPRQEPQKEVGKGVVDNMRKKKPGFRAGLAKELKPDRYKMGKSVGRAIKNAPGNIAKTAGKIAKGVIGARTGQTGVSRSGDLEGLSGRNKGLIG